MALQQRREVLIDTAIELFAEHGYHATGIDTILAKSGVSKKTLYRHFRSKDELILAALKKYDSQFRNSFMRQIEERAGTPRERLLAVYDVAAHWFEQSNFYGCMYINAIGEFSDSGTAIRQVCKDFKSQIRNYIEDLCRSMGAENPVELAEELALLMEGAIVTAQVSQKRGLAAKTAKTAAMALIGQAMQDKASPRNEIRP